jgi:penicillin-binding protein 1A
MNGGYKATPHLITKVTTAAGKVLYQANFSDPPRVLSETVVTNMNSMMEGVMTFGTGKSARIPGWQAAGKSGTTQSFRDALFIGFTSNLTTGVWFGNDDGKSMKKVTGGGLPAKAWKEFMIAAHKGLTPTPLYGDGRIIDNGMPVAQASSPTGNQTTISSIISGVLGGNGGQAAATPQQPAQVQAPVVANQAVAADEPVDMPPPAPGDDNNPYASQGMVPPADVGESTPSKRTRKTTLLDLIMGR